MEKEHNIQLYKKLGIGICLLLPIYWITSWLSLEDIMPYITLLVCIKVLITVVTKSNRNKNPYIRSVLKYSSYAIYCVVAFEFVSIIGGYEPFDVFNVSQMLGLTTFSKVQLITI